jgi:3-methyladenine DNA glycosylase Tag
MNKAAITKHEICNKLIDFSEQDLSDIVKYIDFIRHKKKLEPKTLLNSKAF